MRSLLLGGGPFQVFGLASAFAAAPACSDRASVLAALSEKYGESPRAVGITGSGGLVEVLDQSQGRRPGRSSSPPPTVSLAWSPRANGGASGSPGEGDEGT